MLNGSVFTCFLDAGKSFDLVKHSLLFDRLCARGVPFYLIRLLVYWYEHQRMCVRWGGVYSIVPLQSPIGSARMEYSRLISLTYMSII